MGEGSANPFTEEKRRVTRTWAYLNGWEGRQGGVFHLAGGASAGSWEGLYKQHKELIDAWWRANKDKDLQVLLRKTPAASKVRAVRFAPSVMKQLVRYSEHAGAGGSWNTLFKLVGEAAYYRRDDGLAKTLRTAMDIEEEWEDTREPSIWEREPEQLVAYSCWWRNRVVWGLSRIADDAGIPSYHKTRPVSWATFLRTVGSFQSPAAVGVMSAALKRVYVAESEYQKSFARRFG